MRFILLFALFIYGSILAAQHSLNTDLMFRYQTSSPEQRQQDRVEALVQGNSILPTSLAALGIKPGYKIGDDLWRLQFPLAQLPQLLEAQGLQRIESYRAPMQLLHRYDSIMAENNNLYPAHRGQAPLPQAYKGQGVLLGIIDDGFDWQHPDFQKADSSTRVRYLWDQSLNAPALAPAQYGYGAAWDSSQINAGQSFHSPRSHGSHVAGTAGGNGRAAGKYIGVAPSAELAWVAIRSSNFLSSFLDAAHFLFEKADELGLPCSINSSVGTYLGSHDGLDLYAQAIDALLEAKPGRALSQAAGNARNAKFHLRLQPQFQKRRAAFVPNNNRCIFLAYCDSSDWEQLRFRFKLLEGSSQQELASSTTYRYPQDFNPGAVDSLNEELFIDGAGNAYSLRCYVAAYAGGYEILFELSGADNDKRWLLDLEGNGTMDIWSAPNLTGTSAIVSQIALTGYVQPDDQQSIVSSWTCSDKVITVGSYQNRDSLLNYAGNMVYVGNPSYPIQDISSFSSLGPTRDGRLKPDITAPGGRVASAAPVSLLQNFRNNNYIHLDGAGWHILNRGTSMAAPMVAGAIALFFQCQPQASYSEAKQALQEAARIDASVAQYGSLPNTDWGHGKLDVFQLLNKCLVYGCMDSTALNYNPQANVADGSCQLFTSTAEVESSNWQLFPNPTQAALQLQIPTEYLGAQLQIYNSLGQRVTQQLLDEEQLELEKPHQASGWYFYELHTPVGNRYTKRIYWY